MSYEDLMARELMASEKARADKRMQEVIEDLCTLRSLVYKSIGDYRYACDGICHRCPNLSNGCFRDDGKVNEWIRQAVMERLAFDGIQIADGFDLKTGKEIVDG